jgi:hypothetical protein
MEIGLQYKTPIPVALVSGTTHDRRRLHLPVSRTSDPHHQLRRQQMGLFKDVKENLTGDDVREGL